jgi:hypothetical protein
MFKRSEVLVTEPEKTFLLRILPSISDVTSGSCRMRAEQIQANIEMKTVCRVASLGAVLDEVRAPLTFPKMMEYL